MKSRKIGALSFIALLGSFLVVTTLNMKMDKRDFYAIISISFTLIASSCYQLIKEVKNG